MAVEGDITIQIGASTDKFDKQIAQLEKKMQKAENNEITIQAKYEDIKQQINDFNEITAKAKEYKNTIENLRKTQMQNTQLGVKVDPQISMQLKGAVAEYQEMLSYIEKNATKMSNLAEKGNMLKRKHQEITREVQEYKQKIESIKIQKQVAEVDRMKDSFKNVGSSIQSTVSKVSRLALGIFGLRSAYMALRRASSDLASYDQQYATNLEYIRYVLTQAIAPVLSWIVDLAARLLGYINAIMQAWFGINLFSRGSAESFNKMKAGASGASKAVKEIKKQLSGFDEINMLTDQSDTGTSAGAGGVGMPSFDLSAMQAEPPKWLKWIINNKKLILSIISGITGGLLAWKLGIKGIKALGIGALITGIIFTIQKLIDYLNNPSWENFGGTIQGIGIALIGLGLIIGNIPVVIAGAIVLIVATIIKYWNQIKAFLQKGIDWLTDKSDWVHEMFGDTIGNIYDTFVNILQDMLNAVDKIFKGIKEIFDGFIDFFAGVFTGDWKRVAEGLGKIVEGLINTLAGLFKLTWSALLNVLGGLGSWIYQNVIQPVGEFFRNMWDGIKQGARNAWDGITGTFSRMGQWFRNVINNIISNFRYLGQRAGEVVSGAFKAVVNGVLRTIESVLNAPIRAINSLIGVINNIPGINIGRLRTFSLPRLKTGAIINMPNRGTLVGGGSAIAGEAGKEGVIPLDDNQAMAQLGAEIGKNVVVNITNITEMNGRVIGRELKQVQNEQNFAYNT